MGKRGWRQIKQERKVRRRGKLGRGLKEAGGRRKNETKAEIKQQISLAYERQMYDIYF